MTNFEYYKTAENARKAYSIAKLSDREDFIDWIYDEHAEDEIRPKKVYTVSYYDFSFSVNEQIINCDTYEEAVNEYKRLRLKNNENGTIFNLCIMERWI